MATTKSVFSLLLITVIAFSLLFVPHDCIDAKSLKVCKFDGIYNLGDSISDTGNLIIVSPAVPFAPESAGIPLLDPYLNKNASFVRGRGVNFAVAGATALSASVLKDENITLPVTDSYSLSVQLDWMSTFFSNICLNHDDCVEKLKTGLFMVGEIGGNDYNYPFFQGKSSNVVRDLVPKVVKKIKDAVTRVIGFGAARVVVPGNFPIGCVPIYLTLFHSNKSADYDEFHCLKGLNSLSIYHNDLLKKVIGELKKENPNVVIVYGDYYNAFLSVYQNAPHLGFDAASVQKACCGVGGAYDFSLDKMCGAPDVPVCPNPYEFISWDGIHMTQNAYKNMANWVINDILPKLNCKA
ncbi:gdsl esterase/lipase [Quercus suber]|uniref:Gdsl esterase/lipase n=1 Tax=Quercus suber TaxID=58331 RepID=A0AAW0JLC7_QUESU